MENKIQLELFKPEILDSIKADGDCFSVRTQTLFAAMLDIGMPSRVVSAMLGLTGLNLPHKRYFGAPIVAFDSQWKDTIPDWLKKEVYKSRFEIICKEYAENRIGTRASHAEALCVMMPASLEGPLGHEWANIYTWVAREEMVRCKIKNPEDFKGICDFDELSRNEFEKLYRLLVDIREKTIKNHW